MRKKHLQGMLAFLLALLMTLSVIPGSNNLALAEDDDSQLQDQLDVTFSVIGSQLITEKEDHEEAHEIWLEEDLQVKPGTTLTDLTDTLLNRPDQGFQLVMEGGFLTSITVPDKGTNTYQLTNGIGSSWMWYTKLDDELLAGTVAADDYDLQDGDHLVWKFENDPEYPFEVAHEYPETPLQLEKTTDHWTSFAKNNSNNAVYKTDTVSLAGKEILWQNRLGELDEWGTSQNSDFLILEDYIFIANDETLYKLDKQGNIADETSLRSSINFFARPAYDNGIIVVPITGGALQAIRISDMETLWVAEAMKYINWEEPSYEAVYYDLQNLASVYIQDGFVYSATTAFSEMDPFGGFVRSVDMSTGQTRWIQDIEGGFYWSGPLQIDNYLLIAGEDGLLRALDTETGYEIAQVDLGAKVRSTIVHEDDYIYFTDLDGHLHKIYFDTSNASFSDHEKINFSTKSTSTPSIAEEKAYVGGDNIFAVIDLNTMTVSQTFDLDGPVQSTPLLVQNSEKENHVYFTVNNENGLLYVYDGEAVEVAYEPAEDARNYTTASPVIDQQGRIYYTNDSGYLFALSDSDQEIAETQANSTDTSSTQLADQNETKGEGITTPAETDQGIGTGTVVAYSSIFIIAIILIIIWLRKRKKTN